MTKARLDPSGSAEAAAIAFGVVGIGIGGSLLYSSTAGVRLGLSYYRSPYATILSHHGSTAAWRATGSALLYAGKAYRYAGYYQMYKQPFATFHYLREGEYEKAMIQYFGPIGSVYVYNKFAESQKSAEKRVVVKQTRKSRKPSEVPKKQKMRLWRMGLRWCRKHGRYDRCSLRARK